MVVDEFYERSDKELVMAVINGKNEAFSSLVRRYYTHLLLWIDRYVKDTSGAEDIVQEAFLRALNGIKLCNNPEGFKAWLFGIARNCAMDWCKSYSKPIRSIDMNEIEKIFFEDKVISQSERLDSLKKGIENLSEDCRMVLVLKYWRNKSCEEISEILKMPMGTVMNHLSRAYKKLKEFLELQKEKL